jgi:hypothetical protein
MLEEETPKKKEPYESPRVTIISLRPEEAVLGACKNLSSAGPVGASCTAVGACNAPGS